MYGVGRVTCGGCSLRRDLVPGVEGETLSSYAGLLAEVSSGYTKWGELENSPVKQQASRVG